jgi:hypothetical protein
MLFDLPQQVKPSPDGGRLLHRHTPPPRSRLAAYFLEAPPKTLNVTEAGRQHLAEERSSLEKMVAGLLQCAEVAGITRVFAIAQL